MRSAMRDETSARRAVARWLIACCALLWLLIGIGGITRLTRSGLSIPSWRPVTGVLPPLGPEAWELAFAEYRGTPEFRVTNPSMTLAEYRRIYLWEYLHRLLARLLGALYAVPLLLFAWRRNLPRGFAWPLAGVLALGALQGAMGWLLVESGLVDVPRVSHLRLAAHLGLALSILGAMLWAASALVRSPGSGARPRRERPTPQAGVLAVLVFAQALLGALMAGMHAGQMFPTFPRMAGDLVPGGLFALEPWPRSLVDDPVTIHFVHRWAGIAIALVALAQFLLPRARPWGRSRRRATLVASLAALATAGLGIVTVLTGVSIVPAVAHQVFAALLFGSSIVALNAPGEPPSRELSAGGVPRSPTAP